jgi:hypothetical protein
MRWAELRLALARVSEQTRNNRLVGQNMVLESMEQIAHTLGTLGLTENQQNYVDDLIKETQDESRQYFDEAANLDTEFSELLRRLEKLARP